MRYELVRREAAGELTIALLMDGFRDKYTGRPRFMGLSTLLNAWPGRYPHLFTRRATKAWRDAQW